MKSAKKVANVLTFAFMLSCTPSLINTLPSKSFKQDDKGRKAVSILESTTPDSDEYIDVENIIIDEID